MLKSPILPHPTHAIGVTLGAHGRWLGSRTGAGNCTAFESCRSLQIIRTVPRRRIGNILKRGLRRLYLNILTILCKNHLSSLFAIQFAKK